MPAQRTATHATTIGRDTASASINLVRWTVAAAPLAAAALALALVLPMPLTLPALSILFVAIGLAAAAGLYLRGYRLERDRHWGWEFAGLLVFLGFAAAILTDIPEALTALERLSIRLATASAS